MHINILNKPVTNAGRFENLRRGVTKTALAAFVVTTSVHSASI